MWNSKIQAEDFYLRSTIINSKNKEWIILKLIRVEKMLLSLLSACLFLKTHIAKILEGEKLQSMWFRMKN